MADHQKLRAKYLNESFSRFSDISINAREKFWRQLSVAEEKIGKQLEDGYTRDDFLKLFTELNVGQIGAYYVSKSIIVQYLKWLQENGLAANNLNIEELQETSFEDVEYGDLIRGTYFKDFNSLQREITEAIRTADKPDDAVHDIAVSLIYFAWYGITIDEATSIRKQDIDTENRTVYIEATGRTVEVSQKVIDFLAEYRDAENYLTQARYESKMPYKESYMLLRTPKAPSITVQNIKNILSRFSKYGGDTKFFYSRIRQSGIFNRAYVEELVNGELVKNDYGKLARVFGEEFKSYHDASDRLREYKGWKSMFYPAE